MQTNRREEGTKGRGEVEKKREIIEAKKEVSLCVVLEVSVEFLGGKLTF